MLRRLKQLVDHALCSLSLHRVPIKCYIHECFKAGERRRIVVSWHGPCSRCGIEVQKLVFIYPLGAS